MPRIFISYRRADSQDVVGRLHDLLVEGFSPSDIFRDVDSITPGLPFSEVLCEALKDTWVGLVIIGPRWSLLTNDEGVRRLDEPDDFVRQEVEAMLAAGVPVIPCLVSGAPVPKVSELPISIRPLVQFQMVQLRPDPDFRRDATRIVDALKKLMRIAMESKKRQLRAEADDRWNRETDAAIARAVLLAHSVNPLAEVEISLPWLTATYANTPLTSFLMLILPALLMVPAAWSLFFYWLARGTNYVFGVEVGAIQAWTMAGAFAGLLAVTNVLTSRRDLQAFVLASCTARFYKNVLFGEVRFLTAYMSPSFVLYLLVMFASCAVWCSFAAHLLYSIMGHVSGVSVCEGWVLFIAGCFWFRVGEAYRDEVTERIKVRMIHADSVERVVRHRQPD